MVINHRYQFNYITTFFKEEEGIDLKRVYAHWLPPFLAEFVPEWAETHEIRMPSELLPKWLITLNYYFNYIKPNELFVQYNRGIEQHLKHGLRNFTPNLSKAPH